MVRHSLPDSERSEPGPACAVSSGSPFLPLSPVCCPASSTAACPHLFSCLLFLSHLMASSLCSSGFAFWILLLSSRATVSVSLPRSLLYSCPLSPCPANSRALICVLVLPIAYRPCAPHSSHISGSIFCRGSFAQHGSKVPLDSFSHQHSLSLPISSFSLHGFLLHGLQTPVSF